VVLIRLVGGVLADQDGEWITKAAATSAGEGMAGQPYVRRSAPDLTMRVAQLRAHPHRT
jgi:hypothetical protein